MMTILKCEMVDVGDEVQALTSDSAAGRRNVFLHLLFRLRLSVVLACIACLPVTAAAAFDHAHQKWDMLTKKHVFLINDGGASQVDYAGFKAQRASLKAHLDEIAAVSTDEYNNFTKDQKLAFLINAYNAYTVEFILTKYPDIESIKDLGSFFSSPWKKTLFPLLGELRSLDEIEHGLIREPDVFDDPRIHMAVNCASVGCPALRNEAYVAQRLDAQMDDAVRRFLSDRSRNRADAKGLQVSSILKWYAHDFEMKAGSVANWLAAYAQQLSDDAQIQAAVQNAALRVRYLKYDWTLNDRR